MKLLKNINFYKRIAVICIIIYTICIFINQQKSLATYKNQEEYYKKEIYKQEEYNKSLSELKENVESKEYIEKIAREMLDMYLPNERVYIDIEK